MNDLAGLSIVVTRPRHQSAQLSTPLRELGATVIEIPTIEIIDSEDGGEALRHALERIQSYDWIVFTSANTVEVVFRYLDALALHGVQVAAIGPGTSDALHHQDVFVDLIPEEFVAEGLVKAFPEAPIEGGRVLLPRAAVARDALPDGLRTKAWHVEVIDAYQTVPLEVSPEKIQAASQADLITFTSPSTVKSFVGAAGAAALPRAIASIGPITEEAVRECGREPDVVASEHSIAGLIAAVTEWAATPR